jgi:hypothetical protein
MDDCERNMNLVKLENISNEKMEDFIYEHFHSHHYAFYICIENAKQYDIQRSLITNSTFQEECNICYEIADLKHYYNCDLRDKNNHHGICGSCYISWKQANEENTCPTCRADKR